LDLADLLIDRIAKLAGVDASGEALACHLTSLSAVLRLLKLHASDTKIDADNNNNNNNDNNDASDAQITRLRELAHALFAGRLVPRNVAPSSVARLQLDASALLEAALPLLFRSSGAQAELLRSLLTAETSAVPSSSSPAITSSTSASSAMTLSSSSMSMSSSASFDVSTAPPCAACSLPLRGACPQFCSKVGYVSSPLTHLAFRSRSYHPSFLGISSRMFSMFQMQ
jgi:hypothetical protein